MTWEGESAAGAAFHNQNSPAIKILRRKRRAAPRGAGITSAGSRGFQHMTRWLVSECLSYRRAVISDGDASTTIRRCIYHGKENYWLHQTAAAGWQGYSRAACRSCAGCLRSRNSGIHQGIQRENQKGYRSFSFITKTPPAPVLIKKACGIESASPTPNKTKVAKLTKEQVKQIAETKMPDLNAGSLETAMSMIAGTARSMGITVEE